MALRKFESYTSEEEFLESYVNLTKKKIESATPSPFEVRDNLVDLLSEFVDEGLRFRIYLWSMDHKFYVLFDNGVDISKTNSSEFDIDLLIYPRSDLRSNESLATFAKSSITYDIRFDPVLDTTHRINEIHPLLLAKNGTIDSDNPVISNIRRLSSIFGREIKVFKPLVSGREVTYYISFEE